jgi:hypothetical protein
LEVLRNLDEENAARLIQAVRELHKFRPIPELVAKVGEVLPENQQGLASEVVDSLIALVTQMEHQQWTVDGIAKAISESPGLAPEDAPDRPAFADRIAQLLNTPAIRSSARAADLLIHHQHAFRSARVFTDVRPVFSDDVAQPPDGAVIVQMLELTYWSNGELVSIYLALDIGDLEQLRRVLDRALKKEKTLDAVLDSAALTKFTPERREP